MKSIKEKNKIKNFKKSIDCNQDTCNQIRCNSKAFSKKF